MTIAVVTAIYGDYDTPKRPIAQDVDCTFLLVGPDPGDGWDHYKTETSSVSPRLAAKSPKLAPWEFSRGADAWIWIDGSYEVTSPSFVREVIAATAGPLGQFRHPRRDCIYTEAAFSVGLPKYAGEPLIDQATHYQNIGHPPHGGLWECGFIVYREPLPYLATLWRAEIERWGIQDQVSHPVACRHAGVRPSKIPGSALSNPWLQHHPHRDGTQ